MFFSCAGLAVCVPCALVLPTDLEGPLFSFPRSNTGKRLMAKCRLLYQENEELGKMTSSGRMAKLEGDLALQRNFSEEMKKSQTEQDEFLLELDEEVEGMQSTIYLLQQQLREAKEQLARMQQQADRRLTNGAEAPQQAPPSAIASSNRDVAEPVLNGHVGDDARTAASAAAACVAGGGDVVPQAAQSAAGTAAGGGKGGKRATAGRRGQRRDAALLHLGPESARCEQEAPDGGPDTKVAASALEIDADTEVQVAQTARHLFVANKERQQTAPPTRRPPRRAGVVREARAAGRNEQTAMSRWPLFGRPAVSARSTCFSRGTLAVPPVTYVSSACPRAQPLDSFLRPPTSSPRTGPRVCPKPASLLSQRFPPCLASLPYIVCAAPGAV
ncbi:hypothetical protein HPB48_000584 [Haemaphysalis longicornis]|uniref:Pre-mRNA-splicing regulator female-lethal(2)D n=1 Tax=Haemaphysalis longicornis TaxID=44386 RepID=A0A9J6H390_HAELO|nr:hypothetical protein HPB48_000584 [Haemaphysalis longicornis]